MYSTLSPALFPKKMGAALFLRKKPWGRGCREICEVLSSPDPDLTSSAGSSRFPRGSEKTLVQTVDWCLGVYLALGFCAITDSVMAMSRVQFTPHARKTLWYPGYKCRDTKC